MNLLNLFKKSDWSKLSNFDSGVQQDIAYLIACDSLIAAAIKNNLHKFIDSVSSSDNINFKNFAANLNQKECIQELEIALLSTGVGKRFDGIRWSKVSPETVVKLVGILVMGNFRNGDQLTAENDIQKSGYYYASNEARSQFLIFLANYSKTVDLNMVKKFDEDYFSKYWIETRIFLFEQLQLNISAEPAGLTAVVKDRFEKLSVNRKSALIILAESLKNKRLDANKETNTSSNHAEVAPPPSASFDPEQHKLDHPYCYIPHTKVSKLMFDCFKLVMDDFTSIGVSNYDFRRLSGFKDDVPDVMLNMVPLFDASVLAYCVLVAVAQNKDSKFVGCGVWKEVTKKFEKDNMLQFGLMSGFKRNGSVNLAAIDPTVARNSENTGLDLLSLIRKSPNEFLKSNEDVVIRIKLLLQGTVVFRNMLSHPIYSQSLSLIIDSVFKKVTKNLDELSKGEVLSWDKQKDLK